VSSNHLSRVYSGKLGYYLGDYIHRIGDDQEQRLRREPKDLWNDLIEDRHIPFEKLETCFARTLTHTTGENDNNGVREVLVVSGHNTHRMGYGSSMEDVLGLTLSQFFIEINEDDLAHCAF
jgi:hypothetical protein